MDLGLRRPRKQEQTARGDKGHWYQQRYAEFGSTRLVVTLWAVAALQVSVDAVRKRAEDADADETADGERDVVETGRAAGHAVPTLPESWEARDEEPERSRVEGLIQREHLDDGLGAEHDP